MGSLWEVTSCTLDLEWTAQLVTAQGRVAEILVVNQARLERTDTL